MNRQDIQKAVLAIAKMRTPKEMQQAKQQQARHQIEWLNDGRILAGQIDDPLSGVWPDSRANFRAASMACNRANLSA